MSLGKELIDAGIPQGPLVGYAIQAFEGLPSAWTRTLKIAHLLSVYQNPAVLTDYAPDFRNLCIQQNSKSDLLEQPIEYRVWGRELIEPQAFSQMDTACRLPIARYGALMPDSHQGYGVPIGSVLATEGAVIPSAVGVDIACSMSLSLLDKCHTSVDFTSSDVARAIRSNTRFGVRAEFSGERRQHPVLDDPAWDKSPVLRGLKDNSHRQLGTSGSGNHFVSLGYIAINEVTSKLLYCEAGTWLALLSHSGSRGLGYKIAAHYQKVAESICNLPREAKELSWLSFDQDTSVEEAHQYWNAMGLAERYARANHEVIHSTVAAGLNCDVMANVFNSHNLAWFESHFGKNLIVHRKGATPASRGALAIIPGTMADSSYLVMGLGNQGSLCSSSHGAGRAMSRKQAKEMFTKEQMKAYLADKGVRLLDGGLDESPMAYKPIDEVMTAQETLVLKLAQFTPRVVLMASDGGRE